MRGCSLLANGRSVSGRAAGGQGCVARGAVFRRSGRPGRRGDAVPRGSGHDR